MTKVDAILFWALVLSPGMYAQSGSETPTASTAKPSANAEDPLHRDSPQSAVISFLQFCHSKNFTEAAKYLNFGTLSHEKRVKEGPRVAQQLGQLLDRDPAFDVASLSRNPEGAHENGLAPDRERVASFKLGDQTAELQMERIARRSGIAVWLFSADSVN